MRLKKFLNEGYNTRSLTSHIPSDYLSKKKLNAGERKKINTQIQKVLKQTYFKQIPLDQIFKILEKHGVVPLQEDNTYWSGLLIGGVSDTQMVHFNLGWENQYNTEHGMKRYMAIPNAVFTMTYYKMPSGKYEVIGYVS